MTSARTPDAELAYLFLDLETTGLDESSDEIIEAGIIGTDADYRPLFEIETVVAPGEQTVQRILDSPPVLSMCVSNGLLNDLVAGQKSRLLPRLRDVEDDLLRLIDRYTPEPSHRIVLAGSGVATFDLRFLKNLTPHVAARLQYWTNDVGVIRREWLQSTGTNLVSANENKTHRAFDDVLCHIDESRAFRDVFTRLSKLAGGGDQESISRLLDRVEAEHSSSVAVPANS